MACNRHGMNYLLSAQPGSGDDPDKRNQQVITDYQAVGWLYREVDLGLTLNSGHGRPEGQHEL